MLLTNDEYMYMLTKLHTCRIPEDILTKIEFGDKLSLDDEYEMKKIIAQDMEEKGITFD